MSIINVNDTCYNSENEVIMNRTTTTFSTSLEEQLNSAKRCAEENGYTIDVIFQDENSVFYIEIADDIKSYVTMTKLGGRK